MTSWPTCSASFSEGNLIGVNLGRSYLPTKIDSDRTPKIQFQIKIERNQGGFLNFSKF